MITMMFLKSWIKWLLVTVAAVAGEYVLITGRWWFILAGLATIAVFAVITAALWSDWKSSRRAGTRYGYTMLNDVTGEDR